MAAPLLYPSYGNPITDARGIPNVAFYRWMEGITARVGRGETNAITAAVDAENAQPYDSSGAKIAALARRLDGMELAPLPRPQKPATPDLDIDPVPLLLAHIRALEARIAALEAA